MSVKLAEKFKKHTRAVRHPSVAQYIPNDKHAFGYQADYNILAGAMGLPSETLKDQQWHLAVAMHSEAQIDKYFHFDHFKLLEHMIKNNSDIFEEQKRKLKLASDSDIRGVSVENVTSITGGKVSPVEAFFKQPDLNSPGNPVAHSEGTKLNLVK